MADPVSPGNVLNINVGVLGHVDSGKTSLVRALSELLSTAALDKSPQSQAKGITMDLGFSAFMTQVPERLSGSGYDKLQFTLVDCPGHASLIKTIIGGAQIIDMMVLVIDIQKGIQTQTAECLVIGEMMTRDMIIVLNKVDLLPAETRGKQVAKMEKRLRSALKHTKFGRVPMIPVSAVAAAAQNEAIAKDPGATPSALGSSVKDLVVRILDTVRLPDRNTTGPFRFAIDHCFPIRGQGTVLTGTVLSGTVSVSDMIELPALGLERKVKSMQMFHKPVKSARQGDRVGICVASLDAKLIERGVAATPGSVPTLHSAVALVRKIQWYTGKCLSKAKFHVTVGHTTVMATATFFGAKELSGRIAQPSDTGVAPGDDAAGAGAGAAGAGAGAGSGAGAPGGDDDADEAEGDGAGRSALSGMAREDIPQVEYDWSQSYEWQDELLLPTMKRPKKKKKDKKDKKGKKEKTKSVAAPEGGDALTSVSEWQWAVLQFETPVLAPLKSMVIGSRLDYTADCRIAFYGQVVTSLPSVSKEDELAGVSPLAPLQLYRSKDRRGAVDRVTDGKPGGPMTVIGKNLFAKGSDLSSFLGMQLHTPAGDVGVIDSAFGKSGKFKVYFAQAKTSIAPGDELVMHYRRYIHDTSRRMEQAGGVRGGAARRQAANKKKKK